MSELLAHAGQGIRNHTLGLIVSTTKDRNPAMDSGGLVNRHDSLFSIIALNATN